VQEDPYKLVIVARDIHRVSVTRADFFFADGEMAIITGDEEGVIRMYEYNPAGATFPALAWRAYVSNGLSEPESKNGQQLLLRTEFHGQVEYRSSTLIARRPKVDPVLPQSKLICGECLKHRSPHLVDYLLYDTRVR
jgi:cleavage and polyadenylation specificity factor subunit 1